MIEVIFKGNGCYGDQRLTTTKKEHHIFNHQSFLKAILLGFLLQCCLNMEKQSLEHIWLPCWSPLAANLRCEDPKCVPRVGCIITPVECVGVPLICSRLTKSGPVSEAAQAALMKRLTAFELLSITKMGAATQLTQRNDGE